jgi:hypothetical protein
MKSLIAICLLCSSLSVAAEVADVQGQVESLAIQEKTVSATLRSKHVRYVGSGFYRSIPVVKVVLANIEACFTLLQTAFITKSEVRLRGELSWGETTMKDPTQCATHQKL